MGRQKSSARRCVRLRRRHRQRKDLPDRRPGRQQRQHDCCSRVRSGHRRLQQLQGCVVRRTHALRRRRRRPRLAGPQGTRLHRRRRQPAHRGGVGAAPDDCLQGAPGSVAAAVAGHAREQGVLGGVRRRRTAHLPARRTRGRRDGRLRARVRSARPARPGARALRPGVRKGPIGAPTVRRALLPAAARPDAQGDGRPRGRRPRRPSASEWDA